MLLHRVQNFLIYYHLKFFHLYYIPVLRVAMRILLICEITKIAKRMQQLLQIISLLVVISLLFVI